MTTGSTDPNQGNVPLTHGQRRYLQTIFDYFHEKAEWPKRRYLERTLIKEDLDAREIGLSLFDRIGDAPYVHSWNSDQEAVLTVPDMTLCCGSEGELDAFIKTLRLCVEAYIRSQTDADPQVTSLALMTSLHLSHLMAKKVGLMFQVEGAVYSSFGQDTIQWTMTLRHDVIKYRNVQTLDDYLAVRWRPAQPEHVLGQPVAALASEQAGGNPVAETAPSRDVFIVHGHDDGAKEAVARFIEKLGLHAVILHEQPNAGQTIIEKFEKHAKASFAVVLLTPDDIGAPKETPDALKPRARQNVVLELGYFLAALGRDHVCALYKAGVERPSEMQGVLYVLMDEHGAWRMDLARELKAAGLEVSGDVF